jgi:hypothetical protein
MRYVIRERNGIGSLVAALMLAGRGGGFGDAPVVVVARFCTTCGEKI